MKKVLNTIENRYENIKKELSESREQWLEIYKSDRFMNREGNVVKELHLLSDKIKMFKGELVGLEFCFNEVLANTEIKVIEYTEIVVTLEDSQAILRDINDDNFEVFSSNIEGINVGSTYTTRQTLQFGLNGMRFEVRKVNNLPKLSK